MTYIDCRYIILYIDNRYIACQYKEGDVNLAADKNQVSGNTAMLLLQLLSEKDMYGYEMIEELQRRSNHVFDLKAGTLYPLLHGMEARNQLISYEKEAGGKMRRYYQLTKDGKRELERRRKEWEAYSTAVAQVMAADSIHFWKAGLPLENGTKGEIDNSPKEGLWERLCPRQGRGGELCGV